MANNGATVERESPASDQAGTAYLRKMGQGTYALGSSDDALHNAAFGSSPILAGTYTATDTKDLLITEMTGLRSLNPDFMTSEGTSGVNIDYGDAPNLETVTVGAGGLPATSIGPTVGSPDDLTTEFTSLTEVVSDAAELSAGTLGSTVSPSATSTTIADQTATMAKGKSNYTTSVEAAAASGAES